MCVLDAYSIPTYQIFYQDVYIQDTLFCLQAGGRAEDGPVKVTLGITVTLGLAEHGDRRQELELWGRGEGRP